MESPDNGHTPSESNVTVGEGMAFWRVPLNRGQLRSFKGEIHVLKERCKECSFCVEFCPKDVLEMGKTFNKKGYMYTKVVSGKENECTACKMCENICPEFAIFVKEVPL
jgi:2-oxoglutarate ferredoxin oxidoreductase subunit delta